MAMKYRGFRLAFLGTVFAALLVIGAACGDDEGGSGGSGNTSGTSTDGGMGGIGGMGGMGTGATGGSGGDMTGLGCNDNGLCNASNEQCACPDCWSKPECNSSPNCVDDGMCEGNEGCHCADCISLDECAGYCIDCHQYLTYFTSPDVICDGASRAAYDALAACTCQGICTTECASMCTGATPTQACLDCVDMECPAAWAGCQDDIQPQIKCNPVSGEPCNLNQQVCDRTIIGDIVVGFRCELRNNNAGLCDQCNYNFGSDTYCQQGMTCGDGLGGITTVGSCGKYCCDDIDCGTGTCQKGVFDAVEPQLGICETTVMGPGCDAPDPTPSNGVCVSFP